MMFINFLLLVAPAERLSIPIVELAFEVYAYLSYAHGQGRKRNQMQEQEQNQRMHGERQYTNVDDRKENSRIKSGSRVDSRSFRKDTGSKAATRAGWEGHLWKAACPCRAQSCVWCVFCVCTRDKGVAAASPRVRRRQSWQCPRPPPTTVDPPRILAQAVKYLWVSFLTK